MLTVFALGTEEVYLPPPPAELENGDLPPGDGGSIYGSIRGSVRGGPGSGSRSRSPEPTICDYFSDPGIPETIYETLKEARGESPEYL